MCLELLSEFFRLTLSFNKKVTLFICTASIIRLSLLSKITIFMSNDTAISFIAIDRAFYLLNKSNKSALEQNATKKAILIFNGYVSDTSYSILNRIVRKQLQLADNETLLSKFIEKADMCSNEEIEHIDNMLLELETDMIKDSNINLEQALHKITMNKNFDATLN